ncbi:MAG: hypothetical protein H7318_14305 [Oligoflexus sp.]|nr:hypothetical protein [Oligoflexus sp.]
MTVDTKDYEYVKNLASAKNNDLQALIEFPDGEIKIEIFTASTHGGGGRSKGELILDNKTNQFKKKL